jgi:hypothetical protein
MKCNKNLFYSAMFAVLNIFLFVIFNSIDFGCTAIEFYGPLSYFTAGVASFTYFLKYKQDSSLVKKLALFIA